jgi:hypothetical protein
MNHELGTIVLEQGKQIFVEEEGEVRPYMLVGLGPKVTLRRTGQEGGDLMVGIEDLWSRLDSKGRFRFYDPENPRDKAELESARKGPSEVELKAVELLNTYNAQQLHDIVRIYDRTNAPTSKRLIEQTDISDPFSQRVLDTLNRK